VTSLVRTSVSHTVTQAREITYEENDDLVKGIQLVATLDANTTEICMSYDGNVYAVNEGPRPPLHHQCRTTTVPVLRSWKELGFDLKDMPEGTRASMNGQVAASIKYPEWLKQQPLEVQERALGKQAAQIFREASDKKIDLWMETVRQFNRPLTLNDLERLDIP